MSRGISEWTATPAGERITFSVAYYYGRGSELLNYFVNSTICAAWRAGQRRQEAQGIGPVNSTLSRQIGPKQIPGNGLRLFLDRGEQKGHPFYKMCGQSLFSALLLAVYHRVAFDV
ncbi:hypothetical protein J6590_059196 [Homalodisca vitripennis]|nr:hypothetical protein J6590_059196 [Homalodisca vitripennis]